MTRVAFICSTAGSAFTEIVKACPDLDMTLITDRECDSEARADQLDVPRIRVEAETNQTFSEGAHAYLQEWRCDLLLLYFSRLVTEPLISGHDVLNVHPSLLPAFRGLSAVRRAWEARVHFFGATLHRITPEMDEGEIIAQVCQPVPLGASLAEMEKLSFLHKVTLGLLAVDHKRGFNGREDRSAALAGLVSPPLLTEEHIEFIRGLEEREGVRFLRSLP